MLNRDSFDHYCAALSTMIWVKDGTEPPKTSSRSCWKFGKLRIKNSNTWLVCSLKKPFKKANRYFPDLQNLSCMDSPENLKKVFETE